jgi:bifunctional DNase/RNase
MPETTIPARIADVRRTPAGRDVVVLAAGGEELPIWVGAPEAESLVAELEGVELPRPSAHALALSLVRACGRAPARVRIARLDAAVFFAEVVLDDGAAVDARPSDALVLAAATGVPIEVERDVLAATRGAAPDEYADDLARAAQDGAAQIAAELRADLTARSAELERLRGETEG